MCFTNNPNNPIAIEKRTVFKGKPPSSFWHPSAHEKKQTEFYDFITIHAKYWVKFQLMHGTCLEYKGTGGVLTICLDKTIAVLAWLLIRTVSDL